MKDWKIQGQTLHTCKPTESLMENTVYWNDLFLFQQMQFLSLLPAVFQISDTNQNKSAVIKLRAYTCCFSLFSYRFFPYLTPFYIFIVQLNLACTTKDGTTRTALCYHCSYLCKSWPAAPILSFQVLSYLGLKKKKKIFWHDCNCSFNILRMPTRH